MLNKDLRIRIIEEGHKRKHGHYGSSMSCVDTIKFLYDKILTKDDIFIMSKGHGAPALHAVLESKGQTPSWTIHLEYDEKHGVSATGGSLGQGLAIALGRAYAKQLKREKGRVYCMVGDGELQEGMIWETLNIANRLKVYNLITLVDNNKYQAITSIKEIMNEDTETIKRKLEAFGCTVTKAKGHTEQGLEQLCALNGRCLNAVILDTQKGKGIPFLEKNPSFHVLYMHERPEVMREALDYLK